MIFLINFRLDAALEGGLPKGYITEICGLADSGKTQLCFQLSINATLTNNTVLYIDTKGDFSAVRIQKVLDASGFTHKVRFSFKFFNHSHHIKTSCLLCYHKQLPSQDHSTTKMGFPTKVNYGHYPPLHYEMKAN